MWAWKCYSLPDLVSPSEQKFCTRAWFQWGWNEMYCRVNSHRNADVFVPQYSGHLGAREKFRSVSWYSMAPTPPIAVLKSSVLEPNYFIRIKYSYYHVWCVWNSGTESLMKTANPRKKSMRTNADTRNTVYLLKSILFTGLYTIVFFVGYMR